MHNEHHQQFLFLFLSLRNCSTSIVVEGSRLGRFTVFCSSMRTSHAPRPLHTQCEARVCREAEQIKGFLHRRRRSSLSRFSPTLSPPLLR
jgi:hypothetical protein